MNIGISENDRKSIVNGLVTFLAETYGLYRKTHSFHWNVTGPQFDMLHKLFETHYNELWMATDEIAERIRTLGEFVPTNFATQTSIVLGEEIPTAERMITELVEGHETAIHAARAVLPLAQEAGDEGTVGLLTDRMTVHEKTAWMLRSLLA